MAGSGGTMKGEHVFGPVPSRRLGASLGVDICPMKTCTFDCVYCQLGPTTNKTLERLPYVEASEVLGELEAKREALERANFVTITASGEPTLNTELAEIVKGIRGLTEKPLALLTNGSLFWLPEVRRAAEGFDLILPSLDAGRQRTFKAINRPVEGLDLQLVVEGLVALRKEFRGRIWLEVMVVEGINDSDEEAAHIRRLVERISPDKVQVNAPVRPPREEWARPPSPERLKRVADLIGGEAIAEVPRAAPTARAEKAEAEILSLLRRRPCTLDDICRAFGLHRLEAVKFVEELTKRGAVEKVRHEGREFLRTRT